MSQTISSLRHTSYSCDAPSQCEGIMRILVWCKISDKFWKIISTNMITRKRNIIIIICIIWALRNTYEISNLRAREISILHKNQFFPCMGKLFVWNFKGPLWNSTQNTLLIDWKMIISYNVGNLRAPGLKSSRAFLKRPYWHDSQIHETPDIHQCNGMHSNLICWTDTAAAHGQ